MAEPWPRFEGFYPRPKKPRRNWMSRSPLFRRPLPGDIDGGGEGGVSGEGGEDTDLEGSIPDSVEALGPGPSDINELDNDSNHGYYHPQMHLENLSNDNSAKAWALDGKAMGEEKSWNWKLGKSVRTLRLQRAWVVHSAWASIENVCKILSRVLVNKLQCEHIADHFKVIADVFKKLGLGKDFVSGQALEGVSGIHTNLCFDERRFNLIAEIFQDHFYSMRGRDSSKRGFSLGSLIQDTSSMFEDYICKLPAVGGSSEESLSKKSKINEGLREMSTKENVEAQSGFCVKHPLDQFLCHLLGVLKEGEDLVLFLSGLKRANNAVVERTGLHGEKFVQIHEHLYMLLEFYACLEHCEGTKFASGYSSQRDPCGAQSLIYYLNSNCLEEYASLSIDDNILNIELAVRVSKLLVRPNCVLKTLFITGSSVVEINQLELRKLQMCHMIVIAALSKCMSITTLTIHCLNGEEVHELCKSILVNKVLENLVILIDGPLAHDDAMGLSAMLKENRNLKSFSLKSDNISPKGLAYFGAMLAENSSLEEVTLQCLDLDKIGMRDFMWPLMANNDGEPQVNLSLRHLHIDIIDGCLPGVAKIIAQLLHSNKTLTHFSIVFKDLDPHAACEILGSLKKNKTLQVVDLQGRSSFDNNFEVAACLEAMLTENSTLEELKVDMHMWDKFCLKHLLRPLTANKDGERHVNISLKQLHILNYSGNRGWEVIESIAEMLRTNKTLSHFSMINASLNTSYACQILHSLTVNKTLQMLNLDKCKGLDDQRVKIAFTDLLVDYNFTLSTIRMHGKDWDIEAFMKIELESPTGRDANHLKARLKEALEVFQRDRGERSTIDKGGSFVNVVEEQANLVIKCPSELEVISHNSKSNLAKPKVLFGLRSKIEVESQQFLQELTPILELVMKSTNILLRRNLNMAQVLQKRYSEWNSFVEMYPSKLNDEEKNEFSKGCTIAALFPNTFLYHLKMHLLQGPSLQGVLHVLKDIASLVAERVKSLQAFGSQTFQFIDYVDFQAPLDVQHIYSPRETIATCQTFSTKEGIGEELQREDSIQYRIVQDHLIGAYYFESDNSLEFDKPNFDKSTGVIGVKVTSTEIQVEIIWEDGSYYSGALEDFSYELDDNKQCAFEAFGHLKGAHFLRTHGLKCSPLLVIALAMAIDKERPTLTWSDGKGHIQRNPIHPSLQPKKLEVWECQILYGGHINQLGEAVEWGMNQLDQNHASSSRDNQCRVFFLEHAPNQNVPISNDTSMDTWSFNESNDTSNHTPNNVDLGVLASQYNAGAQNTKKVSVGVKVLGSGGDVSFEIQNSKGRTIENQSYERMQELLWKEKGGYVVASNINAQHQSLEERLLLGSLSVEHDLNYLVVCDDYKASHVSIYWVKERGDNPRLELKWITDIFIKGGPERIKKIFKGLKGKALEVTRRYTEFQENSLQQQSKGLMKWFKNQHSNKGSCKDNVLQMVSTLDGSFHPKFSNDEWKHIVGLQPCEPSKFWLMASYMQAITYSRTIYSSGLLLSTHTTEKYGLKCGRAQREFRLDASKYVHDFEEVKSCAKFSKPPWSLSSKWHDMFHWGGFQETLG